MALPAASVAAIVVTYDGRAALAQRVAEAALEERVGRVILVDNGSEPAARRALADFAARRAAVRLVALPVNLGSAGGYAAGLSAFLADPGPSAAWLLDDDNLPERGALGELLRAGEELERCAPGQDMALLSFRGSRALHRRALKAGSSAKAFPARSSFLNFNLVDLPARVEWRRAPAGGGQPGPGGRRRVIDVPYAAYGGLLIPRTLLERIGLPDARLVLYEDDAEFTARVARAGGRLVLVPASRVEDIDASWSQGDPAASGLAALLETPAAERAYYTVRNRVYFESRRWRSSRLLYATNKAVVLAALVATGCIRGRRRRLRALLRAVADGEAGRLGRAGAMVA
jgi:GT2 family glycosyltransferase